jgi:lysophospholipase L1-like esterase
MLARILVAMALVCAAIAGPQIKPIDNPYPMPVAAFLGDSYTDGVGASDPDRRWTSLVAGRMGWLEDNLGIGGTGYLKAKGDEKNYLGRIDDIVAADPDIVVVAGGQNDDTLDYDRGALFSGVQYLFDRIRVRLPMVRIIAVGPSFPVAVTPEQLEFDSAVREAVEKVGGQFVSLLRPPVIDPSMVMPDRLHVSDAGHAAIAQRVLAVLRPPEPSAR